MPRTTPPKKLSKTAPDCKGRAVLRRPAFTLFWKNWKPKPWANFVVFLSNPKRRKRSFHVGFNGYRLAESPQAERLAADEPEVYEEVMLFLQDNETRFHKPRKRRRVDPDDIWG